MVQGFKPPIDPLEVDFALAKLVESGLAVTVSGYPLSYRISRVGIGEVESGYKITTTVNPSTGITHRTYSEIPKKSATAEQAFDWGKSGAIAAWIGIPIAIVAIAITIWLDK